MYFFPHVCCICNGTNCDFKSIKMIDNEIKIMDKLEYCIPELKELKSPCSEHICNNCLEKLNMMYEVKLTSIKTHRILRDYAKELHASIHENGQLNVELELSVKIEPIQTESPDQQMVTVYRVEVIKELEEPEGNDEENNLKNDLNQVAETLATVSNSECFSECVSMTHDIPILDFDSESSGNDSDSFFGFTNLDIETSVVSSKTIQNNSKLTPTKNDDTPSSCKICKMNFKSSSACQEHELSHEDKKPNICLICMQILGPHIQLKDHLQIHSKSSKERTCELCSEIFSTPNEYFFHKIKDHEKCSYVCQICSKHYTSKLSLKTHMNTHFRSEDKLISCSKCGKKYITQANCNRHYQLVHDRIKPYKCHLCEKDFGMKHYLKKHLECHTGLKLFQCTLCQKSFRYQESLTRHHEIHSKYKCPLCEEWFMTFKKMREHERQHRSDLPYHCNFCSKNFKLASHLSNHITHKHNEQISSFLK